MAMKEKLEALRRQALEELEKLTLPKELEDFRVRVADGAARLQVTEAQLPLVLVRRAEILAALVPDFAAVTLDLAPRSASV